MIVEPVSALESDLASFHGTVDGKAASTKACLKQFPLLYRQALPKTHDGFEPDRIIA